MTDYAVLFIISFRIFILCRMQCPTEAAVLHSDSATFGRAADRVFQVEPEPCAQLKIRKFYVCVISPLSQVKFAWQAINDNARKCTAYIYHG